jgi:hypothetical protein
MEKIDKTRITRRALKLKYKGKSWQEIEKIRLWDERWDRRLFVH